MMWADSGRFWAAMGALVVFGAGYNVLVDWLERRGYEEGYVGLLVVVGAFVTLLGLWWVYDLAVFLTALGLFAASGGPMVAGSILRHVRARERGMAAVRDEVVGGRRVTDPPGSVTDPPGSVADSPGSVADSPGSVAASPGCIEGGA